MTHDPHANNHWKKNPPRGRPWTAEEDAKISELRAGGHTPEEMAMALHRTIPAIHARERYIHSTEDELQERLRAKRMRRAPLRTGIENIADRAPNIPPEVWEDRNRRLMAQRSVTASICGDPPAGFSALEKRT